MDLRSPLLAALALSAAVTLHAQTSPNHPIRITADLTQAPRKWIHAESSIPVSPGPLTLLYPKWIPGEHMPDGPIDNDAGLIITGNGQPIRWTRDDVNMFAIHLTIPDGVSEIDLKNDFLATAPANGFSAGASTSANLALLSWNELIWYPAGHSSADLYVQPSVILPSGWHTAPRSRGAAATPRTRTSRPSRSSNSSTRRCSPAATSSRSHWRPRSRRSTSSTSPPMGLRT